MLGRDQPEIGRQLIRAIERIAEQQEADAAVKRAAAAIEVAPKIVSTPDGAGTAGTTVPETSTVEEALSSPKVELPPKAPVKWRKTPYLLIVAATTVVTLMAVGLDGWWVFIERPATVAQREAAEKTRADEQARRAAAKAQQDERDRQAAAAAKARQEEQDRQAAAAAEKARQEEAATQQARAASSADDAINKGNKAFEAKDYAEAMRWYRMVADQGNARGQGLVGYLYQNGFGVPKDYAEAMRWYRKAADRGNAHAQNQVGWFYQNGLDVPKDYAEAMRWSHGSRAEKRARAEQHWGSLLQCLGGRKGLCRSDALVPLGCGSGKCHRSEQHRSSQPGWLGRGAGLCGGDALVPQVCRTGGLASGQINIGWLYENGWGVPRDHDQACQWWRKAAATGEENAKKALAKCGGR